MTLETNQKKTQEKIEKERKILYLKLIQERYGIATREDEIQENPQA
jgi:hypothetical protein